jgi:hypothetical protein
MAIPTKNKSSNGMKGLAEVRVLNDYLRVIFKADGDTYQVTKNGWERPSGIYNVTLSKANDEIKFLSPPGRNEPYLVKFLEFANRVGASDSNPGVPEPKIEPGGMRQGRNGPYYEADKLVARAKLVVVEGQNGGIYKGLNIVLTIPYIFAQYQGTMITMLEGTAGQRRQVETFLTTAGMDMVNDEIPWAGNVLPFVEAKLQAADKVFGVRLNERGYVEKDGLVSIPEYLITPEMLGEVDAPAKKAPAKSKAKAGAKKATRTK